MQRCQDMEGVGGEGVYLLQAWRGVCIQPHGTFLLQHEVHRSICFVVASWQDLAECGLVHFGETSNGYLVALLGSLARWGLPSTSH